MEEGYTPILGVKACEAMNLVTVNDKEFDRVYYITDSYSNVFNGDLGSLPGSHTLRVDGKATRVVMPNCRVHVSIQPALKKELERMEGLGVITPIEEPTCHHPEEIWCITCVHRP